MRLHPLNKRQTYYHLVELVEVHLMCQREQKATAQRMVVQTKLDRMWVDVEGKEAAQGSSSAQLGLLERVRIGVALEE